VDGEMIDPPANAIISGNNRTDDLITLLRNPEELRLNRSLAANKEDWLIPWWVIGETADQSATTASWSESSYVRTKTCSESITRSYVKESLV
jgi:hypothetical protein